MSDRRRTWVRSVLRSVGRGMVNGLTAMGACSCAGAAMSAAVRMGSQDLDDHGDVVIRDQAAQGIAEIEAYLAAVDRPTPRRDEPRRRGRRDAG